MAKKHFITLIIGAIGLVLLTSRIAFAETSPFDVVDVEYLEDYDLVSTSSGFDSPSTLRKIERQVASKKTAVDKTLDIQSSSHPHRSKFSWIPTGAQEDPTSMDCHPRELEKEIVAFKGNEQEKINHIKSYFNRCNYQLKRNNFSGMGSLIRQAEIKYDFFKMRNVKKISIKFRNNEQALGFVALKDTKARSFIVVKCGIYCDPEPSTSIKTMMMMLYDQSPFNILFLGNHTGTKNLQTNGRVNVGGFYEGQEVMAVGRWLKFQSSWRQKIKDLHLLGISLGGSASLYATLYNDYNPISDDEKVYNSVIAFCPAVDMHKTFKSVLQNDIRGGIFSLMTWSTFKAAYNQVPDLQDLIDPKGIIPKPKRFQKIIEKAATRFASRISSKEFPLPFKGDPRITNPKEYWAYNNFIKYADKIETPLFVWASKDDWLVDNDINAGELEKSLANSNNKNINVFNMKNGNHCGLALSYGWETISSILRGYYLSHSNDFSIENYEKDLKVALPSPELDDSKEIHVLQEWVASAGKNYFQLRYKTWHPRYASYTCNKTRYPRGRPPYKRRIRNKKPFTSDRSCYREKVVNVPFSTLPIELPFLPNNTVEAQALTRWANSHIEIHGQNGRIIGNQDTPTTIKWKPW